MLLNPVQLNSLCKIDKPIKHGLLYNYYAIETSNSICNLIPESMAQIGWRIPTINDWENVLVD